MRTLLICFMIFISLPGRRQDVANIVEGSQGFTHAERYAIVISIFLLYYSILFLELWRTENIKSLLGIMYVPFKLFG